MQRFLLDTHTLLWWLADSEQLGNRCRDVIGDQRNQVFVSAATTWEISIKISLGKLEALILLTADEIIAQYQLRV